MTPTWRDRSRVDPAIKRWHGPYECDGDITGWTVALLVVFAAASGFIIGWGVDRIIDWLLA